MKIPFTNYEVSNKALAAGATAGLTWGGYCVAFGSVPFTLAALPFLIATPVATTILATIAGGVADGSLKVASAADTAIQGEFNNMALDLSNNSQETLDAVNTHSNLGIGKLLGRVSDYFGKEYVDDDLVEEDCYTLDDDAWSFIPRTTKAGPMYKEDARRLQREEAAEANDSWNPLRSGLFNANKEEIDLPGYTREEIAALPAKRASALRK